MLIEPFKIPSGSMIPTLEIGDQIFVNKFIYGVRMPFTNFVPFQIVREPKRGDVIVFNNPVQPDKDFIKRVIGVPGRQDRGRRRAGDGQRRQPLELETRGRPYELWDDRRVAATGPTISRGALPRDARRRASHYTLHDDRGSSTAPSTDERRSSSPRSRCS